MDKPTLLQTCPLCHKSNACAIAQTNVPASHCWCMHVKIAPEVLAQLTAEQKNLACICQTCATTLKSA